MRVERRLQWMIASGVMVIVAAVACTEAPGADTSRNIPPGRYNCYTYSAARPMPWDPGYGGAFEVPSTTTQYVMHLTIQDGRSYQYLNRGTGSYRFDAQSREISWTSGPFAGKGYRSAFDYGSSGRPVIFLEIEGARAYCIGPAGAQPAAAPSPPASEPAPPPVAGGGSAVEGRESAQPAPPAAAPPAGGGGLPLGSYACSYRSPYAGEIPNGKSVSILEGGRYRAPDGGSGTYAYEAASQTVRWTSGPFADGSLRAQFFRADDGKPVIRVAPAAGGDDPSQTNSCVLY